MFSYRNGVNRHLRSHGSLFGQQSVEGSIYYRTCNMPVLQE